MIGLKGTMGKNVLISQEDVISILQEVFFDAVLLDYDLNVRSIGFSVCNDLGYDAEEVKGKSIDLLIPDFVEQANTLLRDGFFTQKGFQLKSKWNDSISINLSGFYTGLLTDINDYIILRYENLEDVLVVQQQLDAKSKEMDHFIYQASHSLRGPVATIKGLINIAKIERDPAKLDFIHEKMEEFANRLDTKLYKLMCFAEADRSVGIPTGKINEVALTHTLSKLPSAAEQFTINCKVEKMEGLRVNEHLVESIIENLTSFIVWTAKDTSGFIDVTIRGSYRIIDLEFATSGVSFDAAIQKVLLGEHGYGHLLEQPDFTSIYSVRKIIFRLQGKISFVASENSQNVITVSLPYNFISLSRD